MKLKQKTLDGTVDEDLGNSIDFRILLTVGYDIKLEAQNLIISPNARLHMGMTDLDNDDSMDVKSAVLEFNIAVKTLLDI